MDQVIHPIRYKFCADCGTHKEHVVIPNPTNVNFPTSICSGCTPMAFEEKVGKKRVTGRHTFMRCRKCMEVTEFIRVGEETVCEKCHPTKFRFAKEGVPLRIQRPSKEMV